MTGRNEQVSAVATLPMHVRPVPAIGDYLSPLVVDLLARYLEYQPITAVNLLGRRAQAQDPDQSIGVVTASLTNLGIRPCLVWRDDSEQVRALATEALRSLLSRGIAGERTARIFSCPCGAVELPEQAIPRHATRGRLFQITAAGTIVCRPCGLPATEEKRADLYLRLAVSPQPTVATFPAYAAAEADRLLAAEANREWRITRRRATGITADVGARRYNLDVDFVWSLMPTALARQRINARAFVTSNRTLAKAITMIRLNDAVGEWPSGQVAVLATPYVRDWRGRRMSGEDCGLPELTAEYEPRPLRLWMALGMNWEHKDTRLSRRELYWCLHAVGGLGRAGRVGMCPQASDLAQGVDRFVRRVNMTAVRTAITGARKGGATTGFAETLELIVGDGAAERTSEPGRRELPQATTYLLERIARRAAVARRAMAADPAGCAHAASLMWHSLRDLLRCTGYEPRCRADALTGVQARFPNLLPGKSRRLLRRHLDHGGQDVSSAAAMTDGALREFLRDCFEVHEAIVATAAALTSADPLARRSSLQRSGLQGGGSAPGPEKGVRLPPPG